MADQLRQERFFAIIPADLVYDHTLKHTDVRVYATLSERAGSKRRSWPGVRRIASDVDMSTRTVTDAVARLEAAGWVEVDRTRGRSNTYWLPMAGVANSATVAQADRGSDRDAVLQNSRRGVAETATELDPGTRPTEAAAASFASFHKQRAIDEAERREQQGYAVRDRKALAKKIEGDEDFLAESRRLWAHRDCEKCGGAGATSVYSPGRGNVQVPCTEPTEGNQP